MPKIRLTGHIDVPPERRAAVAAGAGYALDLPWF